jgi:hypothetical protein
MPGETTDGHVDDDALLAELESRRTILEGMLASDD